MIVGAADDLPGHVGQELIINARAARRSLAGSRTAIRNVVIAVVGVGLALPPLLSGPAGAAGEPVIAAVEGSFEIQGRGFGHGRGMSQWGSQGAAVSGVAYPEILSTYYPGTTLVDGPVDRTLRVHITEDTDGVLQVRPADGLRVRSLDNSRMLPKKIDGDVVELWRVRPLTNGLRVAGLVDGKWRKISVDGRSRLESPVRFRTKPSRGVRIVISKAEERDYRGQALAYYDSRSSGRFRVVNKVKMEDYLRSVVPSESFPSWEPAALRAQSVAARTYALWRAANIPLGFADICDTTACQVYHGIKRVDGRGKVTKVWEADSTDAAIETTAGRSLEFAGAPALTEFSASNGGYSTDGKKPYLVAKKDPWDGVVTNSAHAWTAELKAVTIATKVQSAGLGEVGKVTGLRVLERDGNGPWGGRILRVRVVGTKKTVDVNGFRFASIMGIRHSWWRSQDEFALDPEPSASTESLSRDVPPAPAPMVEELPPAAPVPSAPAPTEEDAPPVNGAEPPSAGPGGDPVGSGDPQPAEPSPGAPPAPPPAAPPSPAPSTATSPTPTPTSAAPPPVAPRIS